MVGTTVTEQLNDKPIYVKGAAQTSYKYILSRPFWVESLLTLNLQHRETYRKDKDCVVLYVNSVVI